MTTRPRASIAVWMVAGALLTAAAATVWGLLAETPSDVTAREREENAARIATLEQEIARLREEARHEEAASPALVPREERPVPAAEPPGAPEDEVARVAEEIRTEGERMIRDARALAEARDRARIAAENARREQERRFLEDKARGGTMALLRSLQQSPTPLFDLVSSADRFERLFERKTQGPRSRGLPADPRETLEDGLTIELSAGVHRWRVAALRDRPFPKDLLVDGAGMDKTLLFLDEIQTRDEVHSLTFRDLTIHCDDNYLTDLRNEPAAIRLERCRVVGFDMGAGGSSMLNARSAAFYATDCRIEAGFGRSPGFGNLFDVRGGLLARLERCTIVGPFRSVYYQWGGTQVFVDCRFERMDPRLRDNIEKRATGVMFERCAFDYLTPEEAQARPKRRSLREIDPTWPDELR